jgi:hypothetical protein
MSKRLIELERYDHQDPTGELPGTIIENGVGEVQKRINPYSLEYDFKGEPKFPYEAKTVVGKAEYEGMKSIWELAKDGYQYVFWLSPPGGRSVYTEGRLVVGKVIKNDGEISLECRGIPVLESAEKMMKTANDLLDKGGTTIDGIRNSEDLRSQAIGINLENKDLWDFCEEIFGMKEVWETIRRGEDLKNKIEITDKTELAKKIVRVNLGEINSGNSIVAGAMFEGIMARWGYKIAGGNHGGTNLDALGGAFGYLYNEGKLTRISASGEKISYCEKCHCWYKGDKCPYCADKNN